jgi:hypothetical protein
MTNLIKKLDSIRCLGTSDEIVNALLEVLHPDEEAMALIRQAILVKQGKKLPPE